MRKNQMTTEGSRAISQAQKKRWADKKRSSEHVLQSTIVQHIQARKSEGVFWCAVPNGGNRDPITGAILKREGVRAGVPDLFFLKDGKTFFLEVKRENGKLSQAQKEIRAEVIQAGGIWHCAKGLDPALTVLQQWEIIK